MVNVTVTVNGEEKTLKFKPLSKIPGGVLRRARRSADEQLWAPFEWGLSEDDLAVLDEVPMDELPKVMQDWEKASEVSTGE